VVYKVDRLTRSLTDFARLVELFDRHGVSFVSITQAFNTTTSMGRLTLNVLLSFAQFEREVIGERVRDKIAASKRKGLWMGGPAPLGYAAENKKLVVVEAEAETVRLIFTRYLELGSIQALATDLDRRRIRTKKRTWANDRNVGGGRFMTGPLAYLLKNRIYLGEVVHRGEIFEGDHPAIVDRALFDGVQEKLKGGAVARKLKLKSSPSLLTGKIYDENGNRMTPTHTVKNGVRYRYYVSKAAHGVKGSGLRVPAAEIEAIVARTARPDGAEPAFELSRVTIRDSDIELRFAGTTAEPDPQIVTVPWKSLRGAVIQGIATGPDGIDAADVRSRDNLLIVIARARNWVEQLAKNQTTIQEIAEQEGMGERYIRLLLPLAFSAPGVVAALVKASTEVTLTKFAAHFPCSWNEQLLLL